jgi:hypothetical protein
MNYPIYPQDFEGKNTVEVSNSRINEWIRQCVDEVRKSPNDDYYFTSSGGTKVEVVKENGVIVVEVFETKGYYIYED